MLNISSLEHEVVGLGGDGLHQTYDLGGHAALGIDKGGVVASVAAQPLHVDLCCLHLTLGGEALSLGQQFAVFVDQGVAAIDHILRALAVARAAVDISGNGAGTLLGQQGLEVGMLADELVARREVAHNLGPAQREVVAGWRGRPYVLTDLHAEGHALAGAEELRVGGDDDVVAGKMDLGRRVCFFQCTGNGQCGVDMAGCAAGSDQNTHLGSSL